MAGVSAPLYACEHYALITKPFDGIYTGMPVLGAHDGYMYIRDEAQGLLVGSFEPNARSVDLDQLPNDFSFDLLGENWDHFEPVMEEALHRIPALENAEVRTLLNGPESFTLDGAFLMGESPELPGFFMCCGMNSMGVAPAAAVPGRPWLIGLSMVTPGRPFRRRRPPLRTRPRHTDCRARPRGGEPQPSLRHRLFRI